MLESESFLYEVHRKSKFIDVKRYTKVTIVDANKFNPFYCKYAIHFSLIMDLWINSKSNNTSDHQPNKLFYANGAVKLECYKKQSIIRKTN